MAMATSLLTTPRVLARGELHSHSLLVLLFLDLALGCTLTVPKRNSTLGSRLLDSAPNSPDQADVVLRSPWNI